MSLIHLLYSPAEIARDVGKNARAVRLSKNLSRKTLAELSGVSESSIQRFEVGGSITLEAMILLATALDELKPITALFNPHQPNSYAELKSAGRKRGTR
jgi:transcriptional regulator with XRE-family HTH domain